MQKAVIHQHTKSVGLSSLNGRSGGGSEYRDAIVLPAVAKLRDPGYSCRFRDHTRPPPERDEWVGWFESIRDELEFSTAEDP